MREKKIQRYRSAATSCSHLKISHLHKSSLSHFERRTERIWRKRVLKDIPCNDVKQMMFPFFPIKIQSIKKWSKKRFLCLDSISNNKWYFCKQFFLPGALNNFLNDIWWKSFWVVGGMSEGKLALTLVRCQSFAPESDWSWPRKKV